jgi:hypothetical protein
MKQDHSQHVAQKVTPQHAGCDLVSCINCNVVLLSVLRVRAGCDLAWYIVWCLKLSLLNLSWTKDVLKTGSVVCKKFSNALWFIDHCHQKMENNGCPIPQALKRFHVYSDYKKSYHVPPTITSGKLNEHCMELTKCVSFPSMTIF